MENEAKIVAGDTVTSAKIGSPVHLRDELRTGPEGRLRVTFRDDTVLTLGENASIVIDRYVYDPDQNVDETLIQTTKGAFLFASGRIKGLKLNVTLSGAGQGTDIPSPLDPPGEVKAWSPEKIARAVVTVALH